MGLLRPYRPACISLSTFRDLPASEPLCADPSSPRVRRSSRRFRTQTAASRCVTAAHEPPGREVWKTPFRKRWVTLLLTLLEIHYDNIIQMKQMSWVLITNETPTLQHLMHLYEPLDSRLEQIESFSDLISAPRGLCFTSRYSSSLSRILQI